MSCGGYGYLTLYELRSALFSSSTPSSTTFSRTLQISTRPLILPSTLPSALQTPAPSYTHRPDKVAIGVGTALGFASLGLLVLLIIWWIRRKHDSNEVAEQVADQRLRNTDGHILGSTSRSPTYRSTISRLRFGKLIRARSFYIGPPPLTPVLEPEIPGGRPDRYTLDSWNQAAVFPESPVDIMEPVMIADMPTIEERAINRPDIASTTTTTQAGLAQLGFAYMSRPFLEQPGSGVKGDNGHSLAMELPKAGQSTDGPMDSPTLGPFEGAAR